MGVRQSTAAGFTLIEVVIVVVLLGIIALGTTRFIVQGTEQYTVAADRTKLIAAGRVSVEKISRRLRNALPNSILVSTPAGRCVEYIPVVAGTASLGVVPDPVVNLAVANFDVVGSAPFFVAIFPISSAELYIGNPGAAGVLAASGLAAGSGISNISLSSPGGFSFVRTSPTERVYVVQQPERFCFTASGDLNFYSGYGIPDYSTTGLGDAPSAAVAATAELVSQDIDASASSFSYVSGTLVRNAIVEINLGLLKNDDPIQLNQEVQVRNVP